MSERYLANENFPAAIVRDLRTQGDDVVHAAETLVGSADHVILSSALQEDRILLTFDRDFGELVFHQRLPPAPGIVLFRYGPQPPQMILQLIRTFFASQPALRGYFSLVAPGRFRQIHLAQSAGP